MATAHAMAIEARYELLRARRPDRARRPPPPRARARSSAIVTSWHSYARARAQPAEALADATFAARGRLRALGAVAVQRGALCAHCNGDGARGRQLWVSRAPARWALWTSRLMRSTGARARCSCCCNAVRTRRVCWCCRRGVCSSTAPGTCCCSTCACTRGLSAVVFAEWRAAARASPSSRRRCRRWQADKREARLLDALATWREWSALSGGRQRKLMRHVGAKLRGALALAFYLLHKHARRQIVSDVVSDRTAAREKQLCLHTWRSLVRQDRRKQKLADAHALIGSTSSTLRRWWQYVESRRARRIQLALAVEERINARELGRCGEVIRLWRAVGFHQRLERRHAGEAMAVLKALSLHHVGEQSRYASAREYYCRRLAGVVFFHWRALSWSMNWEKPGRLSESGYDLSDGAPLFSERHCQPPPAPRGAHGARRGRPPAPLDARLPGAVQPAGRGTAELSRGDGGQGSLLFCGRLFLRLAVAVLTHQAFGGQRRGLPLAVGALLEPAEVGRPPLVATPRRRRQRASLDGAQEEPHSQRQ